MEEDSEYDSLNSSESLLVLAKRIFPHNNLTWHYRSKYPELIDFSNHAFYRASLKVAPGNYVITTPIKWINCSNGIWEDRRNPPEAKLVVDELKKVLRENSLNGTYFSVGVITFNNTQQEEILNEIERRRETVEEFNKLYTDAENPKSRRIDDTPFVKNIENVQGDERDIIIFSVGYAKDRISNQVHMKFGTLSQEGGENRLNVAVTRARQQILVICSFEPHELNITNAKHTGPKRFKEYLTYAKAISDGKKEEAKHTLLSMNPSAREYSLKENEFDVFLETAVRKELVRCGYRADTNLVVAGYAPDLGIVHPDCPCHKLSWIFLTSP